MENSKNLLPESTLEASNKTLELIDDRSTLKHYFVIWYVVGAILKVWLLVGVFSFGVRSKSPSFPFLMGALGLWLFVTFVIFPVTALVLRFRIARQRRKVMESLDDKVTEQ